MLPIQFMDPKSLDLMLCRGVYAPREDSYMLAKAVEEYAFGKVLDLGTGTGIQGIMAALRGCDVTFVDIDRNALECANSNAKLNKVKGRFVHSDMFSGLNERFNTIIFNPPYLESDKINYMDVDGGANGRELIDRFIDGYKKHVSEDHVVLLLESSINEYSNDVERLHARIVAREHYFFEDLAVLLFK